MPIITFSSDFGLDDPYVGIVHGVIAGIAPDIRIIDLTHGIPPADVRAGALALATACRFFPSGTIHLAVVDPGVGTARRALLLRTAEAWYIGPDNGLFDLVAPPQALLGCWELTNREYWLSTVSATFHGRDIFGPAAAYLATGVAPEELGTAIPPPGDRLRLQEREAGVGETTGTVVMVDHFGNLLTNLRAPSDWSAQVRRRVVAGWLEDQPLRVVHTYTEGAGEPATGGHPELLLLAGSAGLLEVAVARGSAARSTGLGVGATVRVLLGER